MKDDGWRTNKGGGKYNIYWTKEEKARYVGGKKVVVDKGQTLSDAMKKSGKFRTKKQKEEDRKRLEEKIQSTETNMADAKDENSLQMHMGKDGKLSPEREAIHQEIIREYFEGKFPASEDEEKLYYMTGGGSGTGKSNFVKNENGKYFGQNFNYDEKAGQFKGNMIKIDADDLKMKLFLKENDGREFSASYLHEESSALSKRINAISTELGYHTMLDSTGDGEDPAKLGGKIDKAHELGYKVHACYGTCDVQKALGNNLERYEKKARKHDITARYVSEDEVVRIHRDVTNDLVKNASKFDSVTLYDMNDYDNIKPIASGGNGKGLQVNVVDTGSYNVGSSSSGVAKTYDKEYNNFISKGKMTDDEILSIARKYANKLEKEGRRPINDRI